MADSQTKFGALLTWAGGIIATIIAGVVIFYVTRPTPPNQVGLNGFVEDNVTQQPVPDAIVTANLGNKLASQPTDSEGRYAFIMDSTTPPTQSIHIDVLAGGYEHYSATVPLTSGDTFAGLQLQPVPASTAANGIANGMGNGMVNGAHIPHAPSKLPPKPEFILHVPNNYNVRADSAPLKPK
jgi:hypothetical protein